MATTFWLTDRSRYTTGTGRCKRERYLKNHFGQTGYGIVKSRESLPLLTGSAFHTALEHLFTHLRLTDNLPDRLVIRSAIAAAIGAYESRVEKRGFRGLLQSESTDTIVKEQGFLVTGLVWAFTRTVLPWIHATYRILDNEQELIYVLDCTCGLGSAVLDVAAHESKGCNGIGQMLKQDVIAQHRSSGHLTYFESKTTGWGGDNWAPQWETRPQLAIGNFALLEKYGKEVTENFIIGAYKGQRKTSKPTDPFEEAVTRQESPFTYGYFKAGNPPLAADDWKPAYAWIDAAGTTQYARRPYAKEPVWNIEGSDWPFWLQAKATDPDLFPAECWAQFLPQSVIDKQVFLVGPLNRQDHQIASLKQQIVGEERRWQEILWQLWELQTEGHGWSSQEFQARLDYLVPASWECRRFGTKYECEFADLCFKRQGWESPESLGIYRPRRPHHSSELDQAIERGLLPEQSEDDEEEE